MIALVVPCHKNELMAGFLEAWQDYVFWDELIVVEDYPFKSFDCLPRGTHHYSYEEIERDLGGNHWIISRKDSAIRSYGFLQAYRMGAETIVTLDTDCYPDPEYPNFMEWHNKNLYATSQWETTVPGMRVRGLPYGSLGNIPVHLSVGLWAGVPDQDGACQLVKGIPDNFRPAPTTRILPKTQYFPVCGMNLAFRREFAVLSYFGLQGHGQPFARFDDIWAGVCAKKICDHLGWSITMGEPFIYHSRASDPFVNLVKEAPGVKFHEEFWRFIDESPLNGYCPAGCMRQVGKHFLNHESDYVKKLGDAYVVWANYF